MGKTSGKHKKGQFWIHALNNLIILQKNFKKQTVSFLDILYYIDKERDEDQIKDPAISQEVLMKQVLLEF